MTLNPSKGTQGRTIISFVFHLLLLQGEVYFHRWFLIWRLCFDFTSGFQCLKPANGKAHSTLLPSFLHPSVASKMIWGTNRSRDQRLATLEAKSIKSVEMKVIQLPGERAATPLPFPGAWKSQLGWEASITFLAPCSSLLGTIRLVPVHASSSPLMHAGPVISVYPLANRY